MVAPPMVALKSIAVAVIGLSLALSGCSELARVKLYNDTNDTIAIRLVGEQKWGSDPSRDVLITLKPGQSEAFFGHRLRHGQLPISAGRCVYTYALSEEELYELDQRGFSFPISLALKQNFALELRPNGTGREDHHSDPEFNFPRRPIAESCG